MDLLAWIALPVLLAGVVTGLAARSLGDGAIWPAAGASILLASASYLMWQSSPSEHSIDAASIGLVLAVYSVPMIALAAVILDGPEPQPSGQGLALPR